MNKAPILFAVLFLGLSPIARTVPAPGPSQPNILVIMLDDVGVEQIECFDSTAQGTLADGGLNLWDFEDPLNTYEYAETPNLTKLAERGVRFTRAFSNPTCSPSRASLLTGRYPFRTEIGHIVTPDGYTLGFPGTEQQTDLDLDEVILPEMLKLSPHNYSSAWFAKWHLARHPDEVPSSVVDAGGDDHPVLSGWPFYQGILQNPANKPNPCTTQCTGFMNWFQITSVENPAPGPRAAITSIEPISGEYITTRQRQDLSAWINAQSGPWFAVWAATAAHSPYDGTPATHTNFAATDIDGTTTEQWNKFRASLEAFDKELGELETSIPTATWDNTVIIFLGDNGTERKAMGDAIATTDGSHPTGMIEPYGPTTATNGSGPGNKRFKATAYMTGTNVPLIVAGPASDVLPPTIAGEGRIEHGLVDIVDLWDTVRDIADISNAPASPLDTLLGGETIDGISIKPVLLGGGGTRTTSLAMDYAPNGSFATSRQRHRIGYTTFVGTTMYRLIRTGVPDEFSSPPVTELAPEFYKISDAGGLVDPLEETNLSMSDSNFATVSAELDAILATAP